MSETFYTIGLVLILLGALLTLPTAIGLLRLPDIFSRQHAAAKPQLLGLLLTLTGVLLCLQSWLDVGMLVLVALFQMLTVPVSAHMVTRAGYRAFVGAPSTEAPDDVDAADDAGHDGSSGGRHDGT